MLDGELIEYRAQQQDGPETDLGIDVADLHQGIAAGRHHGHLFHAHGGKAVEVGFLNGKLHGVLAFHPGDHFPNHQLQDAGAVKE